MKLIGYLRTSDDDVNDPRLSTGSQEQRILDYARLYGHEIAAIHRDVGISGKSIDNRPGILQALHDMAYLPADGIIVDTLNRLTRSVIDVGTMMEDFFQTKSLISVTEQFDTKTAAGRLMVNVLIMVSQWQREDGGERTRNVLRTRKLVTDGSLNPVMAHRAKHKKLAVGKAPYGYIWHDKVLVKNPVEQKWITFMQGQRLDHSKSYFGIALELNERQVPTRGGHRWKPEVVRRILKAEWNL